MDTLSRVVIPKQYLPASEDVVGTGGRFELTNDHIQMPKIGGWTPGRIWLNKTQDYTSSHMRQIGDIRAAWHGTARENIPYICGGKLLPGGGRRGHRRWFRIKGGLFGPGIYSSPSIHKASAYACGDYIYVSDLKKSFYIHYILKVRVALGRKYTPTKSGDPYNRDEYFGKYDSVYAQAGSSIEGLWGPDSVLQNSEWVVYNENQIVVDAVYEFYELHEPDRILKTYALSHTKHSMPPPKQIHLELHPCKRGVQVCINAFMQSDKPGCILGRNLKDHQYCPKFVAGKK